MRLLGAAVVVLLGATMAAAPTATAQTGPVSLVVTPDNQLEPLKPNQSQSFEIEVEVYYPPLTVCLEPEPVLLSLSGPQVLNLAIEPRAMHPPPAILIGGGKYVSDADVTVTLTDRVKAGEIFVVTLQAEGGGCQNAGTPSGNTATAQTVVPAAYVHGLEATTVGLEKADEKWYIWSIELTNRANAGTAVDLRSHGMLVEFRHLPEQVTVPAPTEPGSSPSTVVDVLVSNPMPEPQEAKIRLVHGPHDDSLGNDSRTEMISARLPGLGTEPPAADSAADESVPELPGVEIIPLLAALGAVALLRRRR